MNQISPYSSIIYNSNKRLFLELGGRVNFHSVYGKNLSFTFNPVYIFKNKLKILGNLYSAYKAPTLFQLYDEYAGNNNLKPEKGIIGEFGAEIFMIKYLHSRIVLFVRNTKNAIVYTYSPSLFESKYKNAAQQMNYGTEIEFNYKKGNINLSANYTYTDGKTKSAYNENGNYTGKDTSYFNLYRIPKNTVNLNLGFQINKHVFVNTHIYGVSKRSEFIYGSLPAVLKSYLLADFYAEYNWDEKVKIFVDLKNILNKKYFDFLGYNARKFNFVTGMTFNLN
jgi:vitamin B12 transporter